MRKAKPKKRVVLPDPVFNDVRVSKFVNHLMYDGKKNTAYTIFYNALETVKSKLPNEEMTALEIWKKALENITPQVEVKSRRVGGATFQVPTEIRADRKESISMKNLILYARRRGGKTMADKLAAEIVDAFNDQVPSSARKICTRWQRLTAPSLTSVSNKQDTEFFIVKYFDIINQWQNQTNILNIHAISASWPTSMPARPLRPSVFFSIPV